VKLALLWYELFVITLKDMDFVLSPYNFCVENKTIEGTQCTIVWYIDNNKISHVNPHVVSPVICRIEEQLGSMTATRGKQYAFLGMNFLFKDNTTVTISVISKNASSNHKWT
jgi:hypothetical protein